LLSTESKGFERSVLSCNQKGVVMGVFDVPATDLIEAVATDLQNEFKMEKPAFTDYVKTGCSRERAPQREDWYYVRMASVLYRIYKEGPLGVGSLRTYYGGRKNRGVKPHHFRKASGKVIRQGLQDLEKAGLIKKAEKGRSISPKGHSYLVKKSKVVKALVEEKKKGLVRKKSELRESQEKARLADLKKPGSQDSKQRKNKKERKEKSKEIKKKK